MNKTVEKVAKVVGLTVIGCAGTLGAVAGAVLGFKAANKALKVIDKTFSEGLNSEAEDENEEQQTY